VCSNNWIQGVYIVIVKHIWTYLFVFSYANILSRGLWSYNNLMWHVIHNLFAINNPSTPIRAW
jgi:hypothetical protein